MYLPVNGRTLSEYEVLCTVAALNLLNAAIKSTPGRRILTYNFIKGRVAMLCTWLVTSGEVPSVRIYIQGKGRLVFFRIRGIQMSFHQVPLTEELLEYRKTERNEIQVWTHLRWQPWAWSLLHHILQNVSAEDSTPIDANSLINQWLQQRLSNTKNRTEHTPANTQMESLLTEFPELQEERLQEMQKKMERREIRLRLLQLAKERRREQQREKALERQRIRREQLKKMRKMHRARRREHRKMDIQKLQEMQKRINQEQRLRMKAELRRKRNALTGRIGKTHTITHTVHTNQTHICHHFFSYAPPCTKSLQLSLTFCMERSEQFTLVRRRDQRILRVMRMRHNNYEAVMDYVIGGHIPELWRQESTMEPGKKYHRSTKHRIKVFARCKSTQFRAMYHYLIQDDKAYNLCITYHLAAHLALHYPTLRFVNILNYNRQKLRRTKYTWRALMNVPLGSKARVQKVWIVIDNHGTLQDFDTGSLPQHLIDEYIETKDYYLDYEVKECVMRMTSSSGKKMEVKRYGIYAHSNFWLLPCVYRWIEIRNNYARVQRDDGMYAIYSLAEERFVSPFIYTHFGFDPVQNEIYATTRNGARHILYKFIPQWKM